MQRGGDRWVHELEQKAIWVVWRYEVEKGKRRKVLYSIKTKRRCGTNFGYHDTWATYKEVLNARNTMKADGIGFIIPKGYAVIDLDHKNDDDALLQDICKSISSYTELSPSGEGRHIICKLDVSKLPQKEGKWDSEYFMKNSNIEVEFYAGGFTNRYMTYTKNVSRDLPICDCTDSILWFLEKYMRKDTYKIVKETPLGNGEYRELDDMDIICTARRAKNAEKFSALYDRGDISSYGSSSEADLAECSILAFYTGGNPETVDRLHRAGALMRDKWDREDYREATIQKAIGLCKGNYYTGKRPSPSFVYKDDKGRRHISCPLLAKCFREGQYLISVRDSARGGVQRYLYEDGCYKPYADEMLKGVIKSYITDYDETILCMRDVNEVFQQLVTDLHFINNDMLNSDEAIINFTNGILNVNNLQMLEHSPNILSTIQLPCAWNGYEELTPIFDSFLNDLTDGNREVQELILEFIGVCLSNVKGWRMKKALFMVGPGDTGKSQLKSLTEMLLGKGNFVAIDLSEIEARFGTGNIYGKRLAGSSDMSFMTIDELKTFKKCTGGDSLFAEYKGQNGFEFTYNGLLWFCMNRLPRFGGDDGEWVYNRIMQVECKNVIPLEKQDKLLLDKLYTERSGIIYKAVMALKRLIKNGYCFSEPVVVKDARTKYHDENNTVVAFFNDCMVERENGKVEDNCTTGRVYKMYRAWCNDNNHGYCKTASEFRDEIANYLNKPYAELVTRRGKGGSFYKDYTISDEAKENYRKTYDYDDFFL